MAQRKETDIRLSEAKQHLSDAEQKVATYTKAASGKPDNTDLREQLAQATKERDTADQALRDLRAAIEQHRFAEQVAALQRDVDSTEIAMSELALQMLDEPNNDELATQLAQCRRDRDSRLQGIEALHLARAAAGRRDTGEEVAAKQSRVAELQQMHKVTSEAAVRKAVALIDYLAAVGPMWSGVLKELEDTNALCREIQRLARGSRGANKFLGATGRDGHGVLASAIQFALASTRIGTSGPRMDGVSIDAPSNYFRVIGASELEATWSKLFEQQRETGAESEQSRTVTTDGRHIDRSFVSPPAEPRAKNWPAVPTDHLEKHDGYRFAAKPADGASL